MYSGYEVDDDWCVSVLQSYQAEGDVAFPWSVGKSQLFSHLRVAHSLLFHFIGLLHALTFSMLPGEDMTLEGRRQLALFLVKQLPVYSIIFPCVTESKSPLLSCLICQFRVKTS